MECKKCSSNKCFKQLFKSITNYKEIAESYLEGEEKFKYTDRASDQNESIETLCKDFPYVNIEKTLIGMLCLACNEITIIEENKYFDEGYELLGEDTNILYPTKDMQSNYKNNIKRIPEKVYDTYMRAIETDDKNKDVKLILLRKTLELLLKDIDTKGEFLNDKIQNVDKKLEIIQNSMHHVRQAGNNAAHDEDVKFSDSEILIITENVETIMKIFYHL